VAQLRTLGLIAADRVDRGEAVEVGVFWADRKGLPQVYVEPYERDAQRAHAAELHAGLKRIGSGFLRTGKHCTYCPAQQSCPAYRANLLAESTAILVRTANAFAVEPIDPKALYALPTEEEPETSLEVRAGALYELLKRFRELEKVGSAELKRLVKAGAIIETKEGKVLTIRTQTFETLSKKSVLEALGKVEGEKELARLRKKGAIVESEREMLVGEK
jgi:hypothetical protein